MLDFLKNEIFSIGYFNWWLVGIYVVLVGVFLYGILQPRRKTEWKSAGAAQAWVIALYAEMYGTPLTAYAVMNFLGRSTEDAENHYNGHLWPIMFGFSEDKLVVDAIHYRGARSDLDRDRCASGDLRLEAVARRRQAWRDGNARSLSIHPASTVHRLLSVPDRECD